MQVTTFKRHMVTECECCSEVLMLDKLYGLEGIATLYDIHLAENKLCKEWHDALPKPSDVKGIIE